MILDYSFPRETDYVKEKNIPTKKVCDQIRNIIVSGSYRID